MVKHGLLKDTPDDIAEWLFRCPDLEKERIGEYLGEPYGFFDFFFFSRKELAHLWPATSSARRSSSASLRASTSAIWISTSPSGTSLSLYISAYVSVFSTVHISISFLYLINCEFYSCA
jgi:hypothetical protein